MAKTKTDPSRLAIRMDSVQWKDGSAPVKAYLTTWYYPAWYYPARDVTGQDLQYGPAQAPNRGWNGQGQYPDPNSKVYKPFPGGDSDKKTSVPDTPASATSNNRIRMKDVAVARGVDGIITLASSRSNIKLDKLTTYVLATDVLPAK